VLQGTDANNNAAFRAGSHDHSFLMPKSMLINIQSILPDLSLICDQLTAETEVLRQAGKLVLGMVD